MSNIPALSLLVPTRGRPAQLRCFLDSLAETTRFPERVEVVLVMDEDDPLSHAVQPGRLPEVRVIVPPGLSMGELNRRAEAAARAPVVMLLNDDVLARTPGWDEAVLAACRTFPDGIYLVHVNDTLMGGHLCTFPVVSRAFCERAGGICPAEYQRYRIDDHLEEVFNLLALLGERRTIYLPGVVFEHLNVTPGPLGNPEYHAPPALLEPDARRFEALLPQRKQLALDLLADIESRRARQLADLRRERLDALSDTSVLRQPDRQRQTNLARVVIGVRTGDARSHAAQRCLAALDRHAPGNERILLDHRTQGRANIPHAWNRLLSMGGDLVALLDEHAVVGPGWLEAMLARMTPDTAVVTAGGKNVGDTALLASAGPVWLVDRARCQEIQFDESYRRFFFDLDFALRVLENGWQVRASSARVTLYRDGLLLDDLASDREAFASDRDLFLTNWHTSGRLESSPELIDVLPPLLDMQERKWAACQGWRGVWPIWRQTRQVASRAGRVLRERGVKGLFVAALRKCHRGRLTP